MEEEWNQMQDLQEGIRNWLASKWRSGKEAIAGMFTVVKNLYKKYGEVDINTSFLPMYL